LRLKEWQHVGIVDDEFYAGFTVFDAKFMAVSFFYVYDRVRRTVIEHQRTTLQRGTIRVPEQLLCDDGFFRQPGCPIDLHNRLREGKHDLEIRIRARRNLPAIQAEFTLHEDLSRIQPLIVVLPVNDHRRPMYTHQAVCPIEGYLRVGERQWNLATERNWALVDVQKTFYPRDAFWKWATFVGTDQNGILVAINLTQNVITNDDEWNECCAWVDGHLHLFGAVRFEYNVEAVQQPWRIITTDGRVELAFVPEGERADRIEVGRPLRSDFHQPFGQYHGCFVSDDGQRHEVNGAFGVAEHHLLRA